MFVSFPTPLKLQYDVQVHVFEKIRETFLFNIQPADRVGTPGGPLPTRGPHV